MALTEKARLRYARNILIPGFGVAGQERLAGARVLVAGLGGLGSPAAYYLAGAGVGALGLLDSDSVDVSNLQRQILHGTPDVGRPKSASAAEALVLLNPGVALEPLHERLTAANARRVVAQYDVVVEACDNFETKFLLNDVCVELGKPLATAGILSWSGHALFVVPGRTPCLRCVISEVPHGVPTTAERGVLGPVPGVLGSLEALEVLRYLAGLWRPQEGGAGLLHSVDGETMRLRTIRVTPRADCPCARLWSAS